ncbi:uncharacterized protein K02A2.6-like [Rhipicephalus sanguineus]|uniref:uncharacterized protein K02A2.6-like n=1 Tax=Rhipicephalus sanguineus TaxID=34632 RepID=UPI0020C34515|nr:uncharacterized protein K02A2.6-like [Rhipicephalus sanguineus]
MEVDTGSPVCVIPRQLYEKHRDQWPKLRPSSVKLSCYSGRLPVLGELALSVSHKGATVECALTVLDCAGPSLCGRDLIQLLNVAGVPVVCVAGVLEPTEQTGKSSVNSIFNDFHDVFSEELGLITGPPVSLHLKEGAVPKFCKSRPVPYALRDRVSLELDRLVSLGVLSPVAHSEWASPIVVVLKKDGAVRICGDFKATVNPACATEQYPLPIIEDMFAQLHDGDCFSTLDLRDAYNQVVLDDSAKKICVINTPKGLFCYNRLPFGIASAPAIFQRKMDEVLAGLVGAQAYLDDVLISEKSSDSGERLKNVLERFRERGVKLRHDKCKLRSPAVTYLGHRIDRDGLHPTEKNLDAIMQAQSPRNVTELRSFLGMITFYARFLPNMSTTLFPLYQLLEKNARWHWEQPQELAFKVAKQSLKAAKVLVHFDPSKELKLECDASPYGVGAVLFHTIGNAHRPIGFRSRTLTQAERNYSQLEREALALVFGVTKFRDYLLGREFTLVTDHQPLLGLLRSDRQTPPMAAARIQRWALQLGAYRYQLQYAPGRQMLNADALSRLPLQTTETDDDGEPLEYVLSLNQLEGGAVTTRELKAFTASDPVLVEVKRYILHGWPRHANGLARDILPFFDRKLELSVAHDLVYWGNRVIIPAEARVQVLQLLHETHQGSPAMKSVARSLFWWPGLDRNIEEVSAQCQNCVQNLPMPTAAPVVKWPETGERWSRIHIDYAGPICGKMILVVVDAHTKWLEAVPLSHASTETTINCLRGIFSRFGIPRTIVSDNGTQFSSHDFEEFVANNNIVHLRRAPYHPQSNGAAERAVRTIKDGLRKMRRGKLEENLIRLLFNYRRTPQKCGKSPAELLLGYQIRSRLDTCFPPALTGSNKDQEEWLPLPGSDVYARNYGAGSKWTPGNVKATSGARMVTVDTSDGVVQRHVDQLRPRQDSRSDQTPTTATSCSEQDQATERSPPVAVSTEDGLSSGFLPNDASSAQRASPKIAAVPMNTGVAPQALRRSTRERKPVQRFHF